MDFPCKLFLCLKPFFTNIVAVTVPFPSSLLFSVNRSYLNLWFPPLVPLIPNSILLEWEGGGEGGSEQAASGLGESRWGHLIRGTVFVLSE